MTLHTKIANLVMFYTGEDIYSKRRTQPIVDARSLFEYIMREEYEVTYQSISDHYRKNDKKRNHDCIIYGVRLFKEDVAKRREDLNTYSKKNNNECYK
jgi:chromosomal replication initiation ATPase DnaA